MEQIEYEETFDKEKTEKIFDVWINDSYKAQRYYWLDVIITLCIAAFIGAITQQFVCFLLILIYMRLHKFIMTIYHRQTRIAKYLTYLKNKD